MKILGLEIKKQTRTQPAEFGEVKPVKHQDTKPSLPLKSSFPKVELGDSGIRSQSGLITEEYNPNLQGLAGIRVYDEMRNSDGTVKALLMACTLPIRRAAWSIKPASEDTKDLEIASFVENALFKWIEDMTWDDLLRQALLSLTFGVMPFEKVYGTKDWEGKTYVVLKKFAPRMPKSITQWELSDGTFGIRQQRSDGATVEIPGSKLAIFIHEKEGDNWWGRSLLRAPYKHWYFKNNFYKIDAVAYERQGIGIPMMKMPQGYTERDLSRAENALQNLRGNEKSFLALPPGYEAEFMDMKSSTTRDPKESINHHNKEILQSGLAQFLDLGQTSSGSGSHALSSDQSELFLNSIETIANNISSTINKDVVKELVDMNFNDVQNYPEVVSAGISKVDGKALSEAYSSLITSGGVKFVQKDEAHFRGVLGLPMLTQDDLDERDEKEEEMANTMEPTDPNKKEGTDIEDKEEEEDNGEVDKAAAKKKPKVKASEHVHGKDCGHRFNEGKFTPWRKFTEPEKKVSFESINKTMADLEKEFEVGAFDILKPLKDDFMAQLNKAIIADNPRLVKEVEVKFATEYKTLLKNIMRQAYEFGKNNAAAEMGVKPPSSAAYDLANIDMIADTITNTTMAKLESSGKLAAANAMTSAANSIQSAALIDELLNDAVNDVVINTRGLIVNQSLNNGRSRTFEDNAEDIYALQRSEVLDEKTCNFCLSMDGRVIEKDDAWAKTNSYHSGCRGIWVDILKDEKNPPEIGEVPENLASYYGGQPNELLQPPRPITLPGTLADDFVKEEKKK